MRFIAPLLLALPLLLTSVPLLGAERPPEHKVWVCPMAEHTEEFDKPGALIGGSYRNTTVSEINLLGTPGVDLPGGYYAGQIPFSVIFLGDTFSEGDLLSYAYDFEQATKARVLPKNTPALASDTLTY